MRNIAVFTTSRAEFGLLSNILNEINESTDLDYKLFVGGTHLKHEYGNTLQEIVSQNYKIADTFDYLLNEDSNDSIAKSDSIAAYELANIFKNHSFDSILILGDRHELLPIVMNAIIYRKPIFHIAGGQQTLGAIDEQIRHMVTKASHLHFVACEEYASIVRNMGEERWRIIVSGALGIDSIKKNQKITKDKLYREIGLDINKKTVLLTYHPVSLEKDSSPASQLENIFKALNLFDYQVVITAPNHETNRNELIKVINSQTKNNPNYFYIDSLGSVKYQNLMSYCEFCIGNSSSGLVEAPYFKIPTINVGNRQKGRLRHSSIIDVDYDEKSIRKGIKYTLSDEFKKNLKNMKYKFGDGTASKKIVQTIKNNLNNTNKLLLKELDFPY